MLFIYVILHKNTGTVAFVQLKICFSFTFYWYFYSSALQSCFLLFLFFYFSSFTVKSECCWCYCLQCVHQQSLLILCVCSCVYVCVCGSPLQWPETRRSTCRRNRRSATCSAATSSATRAAGRAASSRPFWAGTLRWAETCQRSHSNSPSSHNTSKPPTGKVIISDDLITTHWSRGELYLTVSSGNSLCGGNVEHKDLSSFDLDLKSWMSIFTTGFMGCSWNAVNWLKIEN